MSSPTVSLDELPHSELELMLVRGIYNGQSYADTDLVCCIECLDRLLDRWNGDDLAIHTLWKPYFRTRHREFCIQAAAFVTEDRSDEEAAGLDDRLVALCAACDLPNHCAWPALFSCDSIGQRLVYSLTRFLYYCIADKQGILFTGKFSVKGVWPTSQRDMLPRGPQATAHGLLSLWKDSVNPESGALVDAWTQACWNELESHFYPRRDEFVQYLIVRISEAVHIARNDEFPLRGRFIHASNVWEHSTSPRRRLEFFYSDLHQHMIEFGVVVRPYVEDYLSTESLLGLDQLVLRHKLALSRQRGEVPTQEILLSPLAFQLSAVPPEVASDPFQFVGRFFQCQAMAPRRCKRRGCDEYGAEGKTTLNRCGGCKMYHYCSRECQRDDWRTGPLPHKAVCQLFQAVQKVAPFGLSPAAFAAACREGSVTLNQLATLIFHVTASVSQAPPLPVEMVPLAATVITSWILENTQPHGRPRS